MAVAPFVGLKGSSWVTTACLDAGVMWPAQRGAPIVIECDPGGGDIAALYDLEVMPGIVSLAAELERGGVDPGRTDELIAAHAQQLPGGLRVVVAPTSPEEVRLPLERLAQDLPLLAQGNVDLIADCGRLESVSMRQRTAVLRLIQRSGLVVAVVRPDLAALQRLNIWLPTLTGLEVEVLVLLAGRGPYGAQEIARTLGVEVIGQLPHDPEGAEVIAGERGPRPSRLPLFRAMRAACEALTARLSVPVPADSRVVALAERGT